MRVAEILSDLTSLRACDPAAALALVSARPPAVASSTDTPMLPSGQDATNENADPDLRRAEELEELHAVLKGPQSRDVIGPVRDEAERVGRRALAVARQ